MRILIGCEQSGVVRRAFRALDHDAWSCDILESEDESPFHIQGDVLNVIDAARRWDIGIFHPPCTHLAVSGAAWFYKKQKEQAEALYFVRMLMNASIPMICIENPVSVISSKIRKPDQIIQPWMFGHMEQKKTCLWLKGLPLLKPTNNVKNEMDKLPRNQRERLHYLPPSKDRAKIRSKTFEGIAQAMATQWGIL